MARLIVRLINSFSRIQLDTKKRQSLQPSKKMDYLTIVSLRTVLKYPEFKIQETDSIWKRKTISKLLCEKHSEESGDSLFLPDPADHREHLVGEFPGLSQPVDETIISKIHLLVPEGTQSVDETKRHFRLFVKDTISPGNTISEFNRCFYPANKDVRNHIYRAPRFCQVV
ncbi:uncharacterized protein LOC125646969 [Ostrea edulis]|uniref:uncharacterized protein LOC125646969 n=2 Tax=Ostrea edulis TaxID=37623 RepID=UPI0024AF3879|nr:uncharacterized protein LOC125646969 [Ostrea edulis]